MKQDSEEKEANEFGLAILVLVFAIIVGGSVYGILAGSGANSSVANGFGWLVGLIVLIKAANEAEFSLTSDGDSDDDNDT